MAGMWSWAQTAASSSGMEAPSRKLKAERAWSSMYIRTVLKPFTTEAQRKTNLRTWERSQNYLRLFSVSLCLCGENTFEILSVICALHEPASAEQIVYESIEGNGVFVLQGDVPLIARPGFALPPIAGRAPGAGLPEHVALHFFFLCTNHAGWLAAFQRHAGAQGRTEAAQSSDRRFFFCRLRRFWGFALMRGCHEVTQAKAFRMVCVEQLQRSDSVLPDYGCNACQREFEFFRLRRRGEKQASLGRAWACRFGGKMNLYDGCARGMRIQIQLQQLEEKFGIEHGKGQAQGAAECVLSSSGNKISGC